MRWEEITADLRYIEAPEEQKQTIKEDWYEQNIKSNDRYTPEQDPQIRLDLFGEEPAESSGIEEVPKVGFDFGADVGSANVGEAIGENIGKTEQGSARLGQLFGEAFGRGAGPAKIGGAVGEVGGMIANPETREEGLETVKAAGYGAGHMVLKIPEVIGNLIQEAGHTRLFSKTPKENILESLIGPSSLLISYKDLLFRDKKKPALTERDKSLINYGESLVQANREIMDENFSNFLPDPESTGLKRMMYDVGSGGSTLALALGMGIATKNPHLAAGFFGLYQKGQVFGQAMEAGLDPEKASRVSTAAGIVEGGLEYIGLDKFMNMRGDMVWRSVARVLTEGGQEGSQTLGENIITKLGGITPDKSTMDILKEVSYSAMIGMLVASPVSVVVSRAENKGTISFLKNKGLTDTEAKKVVNSVVKESYEQGQAATEDIIDTEQPEIATETPISDEIAPEEGVTPPEVVKEPEKATLTAQEAKSQGMGFEEWSEGRTKAFHGTSADFEEFKISGKGSPYKREAVGPHFGTREQADFVTSTKGDKGKTKEFILDIKNPVRLEDRNSWSHSGVNSQLYEKGIITKEEYEANVYGAEDYDIRETLKAKGYDGIVYNNTAEGPGDSYIAFSNDQIKTETQLRNEWEEAGTQKSVRRAKTTETGELEVIPEEGEYRELEDGTEVIQLDRPLRDYTHALEQARKIRKAKSMTKQEVKKVQKQFEDILKDSELVEDKGKFMTAMRNIQTQQQLESALPHIKERIERLENSRKARNVRELIDLELKRTKNLKGSIKSKGRYNYEDNKIFEMMRTFNRLTNEKAQVLLDELPTAENETMSMIERFLSMKANGAAASLEITERVFADIKKAKKAAESSKDEADMERKLNKAEKRDELVNAVKTKKGTKRDFRNRVMDYYMRGFGGIHSFINGMANKKLADELDPELNESRMQTAISSKMRQIAEGIARIYGIKPGEVTSMLADLSREKFDITDETGFKAEITRMELLDIYNTIKNEKKKEQYYKQFGREQIDGLMQEVTKDYRLVELADYMQEIVQDYRKIFNDRNIELFNVDMGFVENYWPASSEQMVDVRDDIKMQGNTASALKNRANWAIPIPKNAFNKMMNHIAQGEHITHMTKSYENLKRLFSDRLVKNMIKNTFGEEAWNALDRQIERISLGKQAEALDIHSGFMGKVLGNWVTAKIALSPSVFAKQLISVGNYMEVMPVAEWTKHFMSGIAHPKQTLDYMWKIAPFLEARYGKGYSEAITNALDSAKEASKAQENWAMALSSLVRMGDIGAIIYGGYPVIKSEMAKHGDIQRALDVFETATLKAQQSGMVSGRSEFQNSSSPLTRFFLAFKNTPTQYLRKQVDAVVSYANGDISKAQLTKTFAIYGVIQPTMYAFAGMAMRSLLYGGDTDDKFKEWLEALAFAPFNAIPAMDDIIGAVIKKLLGKKVYRVFSLPLLDDIESALRGVFKKKVTLADWLESFGAFAEAGTGAPIKTFTRIAQRGVRRRKGIEAKAKAKRKAEKSASSLSSWT